MAQITWRNIEAPDFRGAGALVQAAGGSLNAMTGAFQKAIADVQAGELAAKNTRIADNTNEFMNSLYANYRDPASLQAAMADGSIAKAMAGFGKEIDFNAVRGAADTRLNQQMQQATAIRTDQQAALKAQQAPLLGQYAAAVRSGDTLKAQAIAAQLDPTSLDQASKMQFDTNGELLNRDKIRNGMQNENTRTGIAVAGNARQEAMHPLEMAAKRASTANSWAGVESQQASAAKSRAETGAIGSDKQARAMISGLTSAVNTGIDKNNAAVDKELEDKKYDSLVPRDSRGRRDLSKLTPDQQDALAPQLQALGLNLDTRLGRNDTEYANTVLTRAAQNGVTGKAFDDLRENVYNRVGQGRMVQESDSPAGKREAALRADQLADKSAVSGGLIPLGEASKAIETAVAGLTTKQKDRAKAALVHAMSRPDGIILDKNGAPMVPDANTLSRIVMQETGAQDGLVSDAWQFNYDNAYTRHLKENRGTLTKNETVKKGVAREKERVN